MGLAADPPPVAPARPPPEPERAALTAFLKDLGYRFVALDPEGYRTGSMNPLDVGLRPQLPRFGGEPAAGRSVGEAHSVIERSSSASTTRRSRTHRNSQTPACSHMESERAVCTP